MKLYFALNCAYWVGVNVQLVTWLLAAYENRDCMISGFCRDAGEDCALLSYYAVNSGNCLTFRDSLSFPS